MFEPAPPIANGHVGNSTNDIHGHTINLNSQDTDDPPPIDGCKISESEQLSDSIDNDSEPLGYQYFLCDVNIEYSPGGRLSSSDSNQHSFKMKCLPYMVKREACRYHQSGDEIGSNQSLSDCSLTEEDTSSNSDSKIQPIDVTKMTCAFLGNSEYVPNHKFHQRRVVLEMISAKLSQSTTFSVPVTNNHTNLLSKSEKRPPIRRNLTVRDHDGAPPSLSTRPTGLSHENRNPNQNTSTNSQLTSSPMTSKKFVNYTILIKTAPGLDSNPAVIERRFSDFLQLYQGLKHQPHLAHVIDRQVTFPKKVYMGNFSLTNIAERSILFAKLLDICMTETNLLWSAPFISFLLDKELNEAHRLSLCGDPEDVQALIETVFFIEKKIYLKSLFHSKLGDGGGLKYSPNSPEPCHDEPKSCFSPSLPRARVAIQSFSSDETISADSTGSTVNNSSSSTAPHSSPLQSVSDLGDSSGCDHLNGKLSSALSQRILVTFCILMLTYYRAENYSDLKMAIRDFSQLVSSRSYIESVAPTRHFTTLRACLLFLMNINRGDVMDDSQRFWLKQKLEDIDGAQTDTSESPNGISKAKVVGSRRNSDANVCRVTKADLASMLRDRNFCSFLNDKSLR